MNKTKIISVICLLAITLMSAAVPAPPVSAKPISGSGRITEYSVPTEGGGPYSIAAGPDGNIWFTEPGSNKIGKVTLTGEFTEYEIPTPYCDPMDITAGPDGSLWFTEFNSSKICKVTVSGEFTEYNTLTPDCSPWAITAGPDGNIWFSQFGNKIGKVTPTGGFTDYTVLTGPDTPRSITAGPDGNIWFTADLYNKIGRLTPSGAYAEFGIPTQNCQPRDITAGPDGNLWFTETHGYRIGKITPDGEITEYLLPPSMSFPNHITSGQDGNIWFSCGNDEIGFKMGKATTSGEFTEYPIRYSENLFPDVTTGPDGNIWFTDMRGNKICKFLVNPEVPPQDQWQSTFYFAEGCTGANFQEYACLQNPGEAEADTWVTCMFPDGSSKTQYYPVAPTSRLTVDINELAGADRELSLRIISTSPGIVAERPMYFNYMDKWAGGTDVVGATGLSRDWYFAEGTTRCGFDEYVTVLNPGDRTANLTFSYMLEGAGEREIEASVGPGSRATFKTMDQIGPGFDASLHLSSDQNIVAERPVYFDYQGLASNNWTGGHDVVGALSPANDWYFAEGTTRTGFEEWLCIQNPNDSSIKIDAIYQPGEGQGNPMTETYSVPAKERLTISVNKEIGPEKDASVYLSSAEEFVAERPVYFNYHGVWDGGHNVTGVNAPAAEWLFAEGTTRPGFDEWLCLQNPGDKGARVRVTYFTATGEVLSKTHKVPADTRVTVNVNEDAGEDLDISAKVTSDEPIIVERPVYFNYHGWTGGHDVIGLPL
ncbi:MAG: hypothetical protein JXA49_08880 [Actinobacteria bacterium]|nr:hypothetical protein [Actinomycetota bacterium]